MNSLPADILLLIFSITDAETIQNGRLACQRYRRLLPRVRNPPPFRNPHLYRYQLCPLCFRRMHLSKSGLNYTCEPTIKPPRYRRCHERCNDIIGLLRMTDPDSRRYYDYTNTSYHHHAKILYRALIDGCASKEDVEKLVRSTFLNSFERGWKKALRMIVDFLWAKKQAGDFIEFLPKSTLSRSQEKTRLKQVAAWSFPG